MANSGVTPRPEFGHRYKKVAGTVLFKEDLETLFATASTFPSATFSISDQYSNYATTADFLAASNKIQKLTIKIARSYHDVDMTIGRYGIDVYRNNDEMDYIGLQTSVIELLSRRRSWSSRLLNGPIGYAGVAVSFSTSMVAGALAASQAEPVKHALVELQLAALLFWFLLLVNLWTGLTAHPKVYPQKSRHDAGWFHKSWSGIVTNVPGGLAIAFLIWIITRIVLHFHLIPKSWQ